ncbi:MAG: protein kinase domain-containing protein [Candidatus Aquicultorales bacterium]
MESKRLKNRYRIIEPVGKGGVATVFKARDEVLDREVAVKILDERCGRDGAFVERFKREAQAAAAIHHPNAVTVFDTGQEDGHHFIVMEFVHGSTLKRKLSDGPFPIDTALSIALQIAKALSLAHRSGVIHRDVKSNNIIVDGAQAAKIMDFGIARALDQPGITQTGTVMGTAEYLSPEQAVGRVATKRSDIYAFGIVLYEMLAGRTPFSGTNPVEVASKQIAERPSPLSFANPGVPAVLSDFVDRLLAKDPEERPASFDEVIPVLEEISSSSETTQPLEVLRPAAKLPAKKKKRTTVILTAALTLATALAIAGVFLMSSDKPVEKAALAQRQGAPPSQVPKQVKPVRIVDYDPHGNGGERGELVRLAFDGSLDTAWYTEGYANEKFGNLKPGVGLYADFGSSVSVRRLRVRSSAGGWSGEIKVSNDARSWKTIAAKEDVPADYTFELSGSHRYVMVWVTKLTKVSGREDFRVGVDEVEFRQ